ARLEKPPFQIFVEDGLSTELERIGRTKREYPHKDWLDAPSLQVTVPDPPPVSAPALTMNPNPFRISYSWGSRKSLIEAFLRQRLHLRMIVSIPRACAPSANCPSNP